ncbi:MAG: Mpv17/PMP22 family protein [Gemmatimonadales bacterium]|nr:Mpv17/PMP22 family protein [Gemmatimonadales bacterium]MYG50618.1 Mpv17/PMP22 family protein [Gemmatimonadales bacterium]MYK02153.1 Mpv17/PMP22 family protein [Candidatus Palauibacter ramosifaciens]
MPDPVTTGPGHPGRTVIAALRGLEGRATVGDVVSATGLPDHEAETALRSLLETHRGHLEVSDSGDLLYRFDPGLIERDAESFRARFRRVAWSAFKAGFKIWTAVMLVAYFVVFVVILIALLTANRDGRGSGGRRGFGLGDLFILQWLLGGRGWDRRGLYYGDRHARRLPKDARPPFYKKVFAFIFGPEEPRPTQLQKDRTVVQLIQARKGILTASELIEHTGLPIDDAHEEMGRLTGAYGGDPRVSDAGEVVYAFPELMRSAHGRVRAREPKPAWMRLEYPKQLTGNSGGANVGIGAMNGFNLAMASVLGLPSSFDPVMFYGLGVIPFTFSSLFFAIPIVRSLTLARENRRRMRRNVRRLLVGLVYSRSVGTVRWVAADDATRHVTRALEDREVPPKVIRAELERLAAEFDAEVEAEDEGFTYRFPAIRESFVEAEFMRRRLKLHDQRLGPIVYATSDTAAEAAQRDIDAFDRELEGARLDLSRYLPSPTRTGFEEDFEVIMDPAAART